MGNLHFKRDRYNWGDSFYVYDENEKRRYRVKSSVLLWNRKFVIYDLEKNELAVIKKDPKSMMKKKFDVIVGGQEMLCITQGISIAPKFDIDGMNWQFSGLMRQEFKVTNDGYPVMEMTEDSTPWGTHPILTFPDTANEVLILAAALTLGFVVYAGDGGEPTDYI